MFTTALFTIAKTWKQAKCPSADDWREKIQYTVQWDTIQPTGEQNNAVCSNMNEPRGYHTQ